MEQSYGAGAGDRFIRAVKKDTVYLIPLEQIEIIKAELPVLPVPGAPPRILGVAWHEGGLVPFIRLGEEEPGTVSCGILLRTGTGRIMGISVDEIGETAEADEEELKAQEGFLQLIAEGI